MASIESFKADISIESGGTAEDEAREVEDGLEGMNDAGCPVCCGAMGARCVLLFGAIEVTPFGVPFRVGTAGAGGGCWAWFPLSS